jgi:hypothetical protein
MRKTHGPDEKSVLAPGWPHPYHAPMLRTDLATRTVTLVLSEAEWRALREVEPDSVGWLQSQIRSRLAATSASSPANPDVAEDDEY